MGLSVRQSFGSCESRPCFLRCCRAGDRTSRAWKRANESRPLLRWSNARSFVARVSARENVGTDASPANHGLLTRNMSSCGASKATVSEVLISSLSRIGAVEAGASAVTRKLSFGAIALRSKLAGPSQGSSRSLIRSMVVPNVRVFQFISDSSENTGTSRTRGQGKPTRSQRRLNLSAVALLLVSPVPPTPRRLCPEQRLAPQPP
jgi:hypothetical protein